MTNKTTAKIICTCKHEQQDQMYGKQRRLANVTAKGDQQSREVRCTVCSKVQRVPVSALG